MAKLTPESLLEIRNDVMKTWSRDKNIFGPCAVLKAELAQTIDEFDTWIDSNAVAFLNAISEPAKSALTTKQKIYIFRRILDERFGEL
jgi:hypothetical protein